MPLNQMVPAADRGRWGWTSTRNSSGLQVSCKKLWTLNSRLTPSGKLERSMIRLLLDFPWSIDAALDPGSPSRKVIRDYEQFRARLQLKPVEFIDEQERSVFMERLTPGPHTPHGSWIGAVLRFIAHHSITQAAGADHATPMNGPGGLRDTWRRVLRDEMGDLNNWPTPQIIVCIERSLELKQSVHD